MPHAHDPRPENGAAILALANHVITSSTSHMVGNLRVEFDRGDWRVKDDRGNSWRVLDDAVLSDGVMFEIETLR